MASKQELVMEVFEDMFPDATCELNYTNLLELLIAVMLSAQTTDKSVNRLTETLFQKYKCIDDYSNASFQELEDDLKKIGLYRNKAKNIKLMVERLVDEYNYEVPNTMKDLTSLAGVGRKTASVVLAEGFKIPAIPVDTHVHRVTTRLGFVPVGSSTDDVEKKLKKLFPKKHWIKLHHQFIFFGRYHCLARSPKCQICNLSRVCKYYKSI